MIHVASTAATHPHRLSRSTGGQAPAMSDLRFFLTAYAGGLAFFFALLA